MLITRQTIAEKVEAYLRHQINLNDLVAWAEQEMMEGDFDSQASRDATARLGVADVRAFGLTWEDCEQLLASLGFNAKVSIVSVGRI
ncbi:MAG TPA: hypothetical protein VHX86_07025 [Tepidisphaeraceae bacterium]|jgi:cobyrinic acid a,c-diamide synthase|nr:hypothetical protein [Tepidisphaeraceae bacterium]